MPEQDMKRLSETELDRIRKADVSPEMMAVARHDPEAVGKRRNSTREELRTMVRTTPKRNTPGEDLPVEQYGGGFFDALREGRLGEAFIRADISNTLILLGTFGRDYIIESIIADEEWDSVRAADYVDNRIDEYGNGQIW